MDGLLVRVALPLYLAAAQMSHDPIKVGLTFMASDMDPKKGSTPWALVSHGIAEKLFTVDKMGKVVPQLGQSVTKINTYSWTVALKADRKFSDGTAVTADDVVRSLTTQNTQNSNGNDALGTMTVTKVDPVTIQIVSTIAHPAMDVALANWVFVIFKESGGNYKYLFTGPFAVETFQAGVKIDLIPNQYYTAKGMPLVTIKKYSNGNALADALAKSPPEVDLAFHLPIDRLTALRALPGITIKSFEVGYQYMMFHNMRAGMALSDLNVRKAVDKVIDRQALAQQLAGGTATRSLFPDNSPYYLTDSMDLHADKSGAATLLDQAGWVLENGKRMKDGKQLSLHLVSYPFRPGLGIMAPLIKTSLESLGIKVQADDVDLWSAPHNTILSDKTYDLLMWAQHTLPNGDPQWFLNAFFRGDPMDGRNYANFSSSTVDGLLNDFALAETANDARINAASAAHSAILAQVPVSNLVTPQWHVGVTKRLAKYDPWGADYYVIRADFHDDSPPTPAPSPMPTAAQEASSASHINLSGLSVVSILLLCSMYSN